MDQPDLGRGRRAVTTDDALSQLCLRCGLCCDGNLFTQVPLAAAEVADARRRGLTIAARPDGGDALRQRCDALTGTRCKIYDERPASCRRYHCMLHAALAADEVSLASALALVDEAHARLTALAAELPADADAAMQRARRAVRDGLATDAAREALQRAAAHLGRHFHRDAGR